MKNWAEVIESYGKIRTTCVTAEVPGVYAANQQIHGTLDPSKADMVGRYGVGFGTTFKQDMSVLPAISMVPDRENANHGRVGGMPGAEGGSLNRSGSGTKIDDDVAVHFGLPVPYFCTQQDVDDLGYCVDFTTQIFYPTFIASTGPDHGPLPTPPSMNKPAPVPPVAPDTPNPAVGAHNFAHVTWTNGLRDAILGHGMHVSPALRDEIEEHYKPLLLRAAAAGIIQPDGSLTED